MKDLIHKCCGATIKGDYRYQLWRWWDFDKPMVVWIMLNPSTADGRNDDPTIRRCIGFTKKLNCGGMNVVNLFAFRTTDPQKLMHAENPVGPENDEYIIKVCEESQYIICAWGNHGAYQNRGMQVVNEIWDHNLITKRLGPTTKNGHPRHPLYLPYATPLEDHP